MALAALVVLGGLVLPALAAGPLLSARDDATRAEAALAGADLAAAREALGEAHRGFRRARVILRNPLAWPAGAVPALGQNLRASGAVARAGELTAAGGLKGIDAVLGLPGGLGALAPRDGAVPLDSLQALAPGLRAAAADLERARQTIERAPSVLLLPRVADARAKASRTLAAAAPPAAGAAALVEQLPAFLGADGPRRYFFGASNPAEARGSGGFIGSYAILEIEDGALTFSDFAPIQDLPAVPAARVDPPNADFAARFDRYSSSGFWHNINMTTDFPSAAVAIERLYEHVEGDRLDGTILADPFAFAALVEVSGPVEVPGGPRMGHSEIVEFIANEAYGEFPSEDERKRVLGAVAAGALSGVLEGGAEPVEAASAIVTTAGQGHLLLHAVDPEVQAAFAAAGVDGAMFRGPGDYLAVAVNNAASNKADYYLDTDLRYRVDLSTSAPSTARLDVALTNETPTTGLPGRVIGPNVAGLQAGDNRSLLSVLCARCELDEFSRDDGGGEPVEEEELGRRVFTSTVVIPSGETRTLAYRWETTGTYLPDEFGIDGRYRLHVQSQPSIRPRNLEVEVVLPEDLHVLGVSDGVEVTDGVARWSGTLGSELVIEIELARSERERIFDALRRFLRQDLIRL